MGSNTKDLSQFLRPVFFSQSIFQGHLCLTIYSTTFYKFKCCNICICFLISLPRLNPDRAHCNGAASEHLTTPIGTCVAFSYIKEIPSFTKLLTCSIVMGWIPKIEILTSMGAFKNIWIPKKSQFSLDIVFQILSLVIMFKSLLVEMISYYLICISLNEIKQIFFCNVFYLHTLSIVLLGFWFFFTNLYYKYSFLYEVLFI